MSVLGAVKSQNIVCTLFSAFGPEPIHTRMEIGEADVLVTTPALYERKVAALRPRLPHLRHVPVVSGRRWRSGAYARFLRASTVSR